MLSALASEDDGGGFAGAAGEGEEEEEALLEEDLVDDADGEVRSWRARGGREKGWSTATSP